MPSIKQVTCLSLAHKAPQSELKKLAERTFAGSFSALDRLLESFDNSEIKERNLCVPIEYFGKHTSFKQRNDEYVQLASELTSESVNACLDKCGIDKDEVTDFIFVSSTGLSTPSIDALVVNKLKLNQNITRIPLWGLGCAGGVAGMSLANKIASANPEAKVIVAATELCSLTFIRNDNSKSNLIATGLFSDGIAAALVCGDKAAEKISGSFDLRFIDSRSKIYYDSIDVMGWEIIEEGFKVVFSRDIPNIVSMKVKDDVLAFVASNDLTISDISNFIIHPGGVKVIDAYVKSLGIRNEQFKNTRTVLQNFGNMSSATVLYVLNEFSVNGFKKGMSLMASLGPGFTSEMLLLESH